MYWCHLKPNLNSTRTFKSPNFLNKVAWALYFVSPIKNNWKKSLTSCSITGQTTCKAHFPTRINAQQMSIQQCQSIKQQFWASQCILMVIKVFLASPQLHSERKKEAILARGSEFWKFVRVHRPGLRQITCKQIKDQGDAMAQGREYKKWKIRNLALKNPGGCLLAARPFCSWKICPYICQATVSRASRGHLAPCFTASRPFEAIRKTRFLVCHFLEKM